MSVIEKHKSIPASSLVRDSFSNFNYADNYSIPVPVSDKLNIDEVFKIFLKYEPKWVKSLVMFRNFLVKFAGVKIETQQEMKSEIRAGEKAGMFLIVNRNSNEIVFGEDNSHLNFQSSVLLQRVKGQAAVHSITVVHYNNMFGRFYFFIIKPFHRLIVRNSLLHLAKVIAKS